MPRLEERENNIKSWFTAPINNALLRQLPGNPQNTESRDAIVEQLVFEGRYRPLYPILEKINTENQQALFAQQLVEKLAEQGPILDYAILAPRTTDFKPILNSLEIVQTTNATLPEELQMRPASSSAARNTNPGERLRHTERVIGRTSDLPPEVVRQLRNVEQNIARGRTARGWQENRPAPISQGQPYEPALQYDAERFAAMTRQPTPDRPATTQEHNPQDGARSHSTNLQRELARRNSQGSNQRGGRGE